MGQKRLHRTIAWGRSVHGTPLRHCGADTSTTHPGVGQKQPYGALARGTNVPVRPSVGHTHSHRSRVWGGQINNTPRHRQKHPHCTLVWGRHICIAPQCGGRSVRSTPQHLCGPYRFARHPNVGCTCQQHALAWGKKVSTPVWGKHVHIAPQRGAQTSAVPPSASVGPRIPHCTSALGRHVNSTPQHGA